MGVRVPSWAPAILNEGLVKARPFFISAPPESGFFRVDWDIGAHCLTGSGQATRRNICTHLDGELRSAVRGAARYPEYALLTLEP